MEGVGGVIKRLDRHQPVYTNIREKIDAKDQGSIRGRGPTGLGLAVLVSLFQEYKSISGVEDGVEQQCQSSRLSPVFFCLLVFLCYHPTNVGYLPTSFQVKLAQHP